MRFKVDENLPAEVAGMLVEHGHDAITVNEQGMKGYGDAQVAAAVCAHEDRALISLDLDLANIREYPPGRYAGFVVLRLGSQDKMHVLEVMNQLLPLFDLEPLNGRLWGVVDEQGVRIRG